MATGGHASKLAQRGTPPARLAGGAVSPLQLPLPFFTPALPESKSINVRSAHASKSGVGKPAARLPTLDGLTTREVLKVVDVDRSTLFRWVKKRRFPRKHKSGRWLRSDVEKWLAEREGEHR